MKALYVSPRRYRYSKLEAAEGYWWACADAGLVPSVELVSVLVGQGALESGNFQVGCWNNNPGNIKASEAYDGKYTCITLNEVLKNVRTGKFETRWFAPEGELTADPRKGGILKRSPLPVPPGDPQTRMRAFDTLSHGLADKVRFFQQPAWSEVLVPARRGDAGNFVRMIRARRYFTAYANISKDKPTPYETSVISLARTYRPFVEQVAKAAEAGRPEPAPSAEVEQPLLAMRFDGEPDETIA